MRLELGSGYSPTPGFVHLDINPAAPDVQIVGTVFPLQVPERSCDEIRAVDVLEHLPYRQTVPALKEWARALRPGGKLYVQVPDAASIMHWYVTEPTRLLERLPRDVPQSPEGGAAWRLLGGQDDDVCVHDGDDWRWNSHYALFSETSLMDALYEAGLTVDTIGRNDHPNLLCWSHKP